MKKYNSSDNPEFLNEYLVHMKIVRGRSERTVQEYYFDIRMFLKYIYENRYDTGKELEDIDISGFTEDDIRKVSVSDIYNFIFFTSDERSNGDKARYRKLSALRSFFKYLNKVANIIQNDPTKDIELMTPKTAPPKFLSLNESLKLLEAAIAEKGWQPGYDYYLMDCYFGLQEYEKAMQHAKNFLAGDCFAYGGDSHVYHMILECMRALKMADAEMLQWAEEAGRKHPTLPEFYAERGMILCGLGRLPEARQQLIEALLHYEQHTADKKQESYFSPLVAAKTAARLGEIAMYYDDAEEAAIWFRQAMTYCDTDENVTAKVKKFLEWAEDKGIMP